MGLSVVLLSYQEAENLRVLLPQIIHNVRQCGEAYEVIVVDVNPSLDNTEEVCKEFGVDYYLQEEPCFGGAFRTAIKYAKKDKFLIMDSDGSHDPKYIPDIYHKFVEENNDVVIGSRYVKGGKTNDELS
ncbi:MAG TPA: glycosyltransferase family 2 protein, partial [Methanofastidiosum sp.]|nr:glycosyltransferase family 2 protein [Methanofastidiosum sp.]